MVNSRDKLVGKKVVVVGGSSGSVERRTCNHTTSKRYSIGNGAALALLEYGAHVTIISSSQEKVDSVLKKINNPNLQGKVVSVSYILVF